LLTLRAWKSFRVGGLHLLHAALGDAAHRTDGRVKALSVRCRAEYPDDVDRGLRGGHLAARDFREHFGQQFVRLRGSQPGMVGDFGRGADQRRIVAAVDEHVTHHPRMGIVDGRGGHGAQDAESGDDG
jgi:hypothetical protein